MCMNFLTADAAVAVFGLINIGCSQSAGRGGPRDIGVSVLSAAMVAVASRSFISMNLSSIASLVPVAILAANCYLGANRGVLFVTTCLLRIVQLVYQLQMHTETGIAVQLVLSLLILWKCLQPTTRSIAVKYAQQLLHLDAIATLYKWESGKKDVDEFCSKDTTKELMDMSSQLKFNVSEPYFVLKSVLRVAAKPLLSVLAIQVLGLIANHYRGVVLIKIYSTFATTNPATDGLGLWIIAIWVALGVGNLIKQYGIRRMSVLQNHIQMMLSTKAIEMYMVKNSSAGLSKSIHMIIGNLLFQYAAIFSTCMDLVAGALSQLFHVYVVVSQMGWRSLIPVAVAVANVALCYAAKLLEKTYMTRLEIKTQPKFNYMLDTLINKMRAIKFYAWEHLFLHGQGFDGENERTPLIVRILTATIEIVASAVPQIASAFMLMSFVGSNGNITYVDLVIILSAVESLISFTKMFASVPDVLKNIKKTEAAYVRIIDEHKTDYISQQLTENLSGAAVAMEECQFSWGAGKFELLPTTLSIKKGEFVSIIGKVGSGKSSLLSAICSEMPLKSGKGQVCGSIGYVSQKPWIMNATFRDNILLGNDYDEKLYNQVIEACALVEDIKQLPAGDMTEIGPKGINISGGQKARLALARAIYTGADIYVLDDILSAVDVEVGRHIIEHVLTGNGMISQKTRILVTHAEYVVPLSDQVIVVSNGSISISQQASTQFQSIFKHAVAASDKIAESGNTEDAGAHTIMPELNVAPYNSSMMWKFIALSGYSIVVFCFAVQFANAYLVYMLEHKRINLLATTNNEYIDATQLQQFLLINAMIAIMHTLAHVLSSWVSTSVWLRIASKEMREMLVHSLLFSRLITFERISQHSIKRIFNDERLFIVIVLPKAIINNSYTFFTAGYTLLNMLQTSAPMILSAVPFAGLLWWADNRIAATVANLSTQLTIKSRHKFMNWGNEIIDGQSVIRIHGKVGVFARHHLKLGAVDSCMDELKKSLSGLKKMVDSMIVETLTLGTMLWLKWLQYSGNYTAGPGEIHVMAELATSALGQLSNITISSPGLSMCQSMLARFFAYAEGLEQETMLLEDNSSVPANWPNEGKVSVQNYSMRYRKELSLVLEDLSFEVKAKEKVGIVGRTGAGKSSLIHALLRIVEPDSGRICIDGVDVSTMGVRKLRSHITVVPQDPMLFEGTIRDNLDPENKYADEQIWEAMKRAQIDELVRVPTGKYTGGASVDQIDRRGVPGEWIAGTGLDKWVEPDGKNFSVGQRQLVCLCRALLWQRSIVILDEATANVDTATDAIIQEIIRTQFKQCTVITIAHRLNTIMDSDRVLVMDQGKAVEFDTPERLLQQKNSRFAQLVRNTEFKE